MEDQYAPKSHLLTNEVYVELNMLRATMMNGVGGELDRRDIVTVDNDGLVNRRQELM